MRRYLKTIVATLAVASLGGAAWAASKDEDAIKARVDELITNFNKGDARALAAFWVEDGTLVNPVGVVAKGRAEIEKVLAADLGSILKGTTMEMLVTGVRRVGKDAAWVEIEHSVTSATAADGRTKPPMTFHVPCLMLKRGKVWMIAEARPYAYLPPPGATAAKK